MGLVSDIWSKFGQSFTSISVFVVTSPLSTLHCRSPGITTFNERHPATAVASEILQVTGEFCSTDSIFGMTQNAASNSTVKMLQRATSKLVRALCCSSMQQRNKGVVPKLFKASQVRLGDSKNSQAF